MSNNESGTTVTRRAFRDVMGLFATGVTVVAVNLQGQTHGMTANAITSVSLDPLLILVCVHKEAVMAEILEKSAQFSINILSEDQENLSTYFASMWPEGADAPDFVFESWQGQVRLQGAIGVLGCQIDKFLDGGDHWIITGLVVDLDYQENPANPLLYYRGRYHRFLDS